MPAILFFPRRQRKHLTSVTLLYALSSVLTPRILCSNIASVRGLLGLVTTAVFVSSGWAQSSACDLNQDGTVNVVDVQLATNMALGLAPCTANIYGTGVCNVIVVQRVTNAVLGGACVTGTTATTHSVTLNWTGSTSSNVVGYNVYRGTTTGGPYAKVTSASIAGLGYTDNNVLAGQTYYYVATAVDSNNNESAYSTEAKAAIPTP